MAKVNPSSPVRIDQDIYDFFVKYAEKQPGYKSTTQVINDLLRQTMQARIWVINNEPVRRRPSEGSPHAA